MKTKSFIDKAFSLKLPRFKILKCAIAATLLLTVSCTDLDTDVYDQVEPSDFWNTPQQIAAGVAPAYAGLRGYTNTFGFYTYSLLELSSDEIIVPTRGSDWSDNGNYRAMWMHTWTPTHPFMAGGWQFIYSGVAQVNQILGIVEALEPQPTDIGAIRAELKTVRAFYHYLALDLFGNVPIVESSDPETEICTRPRAEVFAFVEKELKDNLPNLPTEVSPLTYGRATQWFAHTLLAKLYLNAEVFIGVPRWSDCIAECDAVLNSGNYVLESDFFDNFIVVNEGSKENIFSLPFDIQNNLDFHITQLLTLHYNSGNTFGLASGGANGFCTAKPFYDMFDPNDARREMFLVGQQYENQIEDSLHLQYDTDVNLPLIFDPEIPVFSSPEASFRMAGARCAKWEFNKISWGNMSNDFAVFRLADVILMKAEAQYRNGDAGGALTTINQQVGGVSIRSRAGMPDFAAGEMNPDGLLAERARELAWEGHRRNDMIRLGHFTDARVPEKAVSEAFRALYPIPAAELNKNPCLTQNPGY
jgi:hypothetical protein